MELLSPKGLKNKLAYTILKERAGVDSKSNKAIGALAEFVSIAIEEEHFLNQDINDCKGKITSNIGQIIDGILHDSVWIKTCDIWSYIMHYKAVLKCDLWTDPLMLDQKS